jgi:O-antigen/teichoic acid export membrane protein
MPLVVMAALTTLLGQLDILMLGTLASARQTGLYSAAVRYATLASFALTASNIIVAPLISELYHTGKLQDLRSLVQFVTRWTALFATAVALIFVFLGRPLLSIFGNEYPAAYGPALVLLIGQVVNAITGPVGYLMVLTGRHVYALIVYLAACVLNVSINVVAIPRLGMYGAAIGTAASIMVANIMMYWVANRQVLRSGVNEGGS